MGKKQECGLKKFGLEQRKTELKKEIAKNRTIELRFKKIVESETPSVARNVTAHS